MTDSNPARPSDRNIARFRQFKQAPEFRIPGGGNPAARERDRGTRSGRPLWQVRSVSNLRHTRGNGLEQNRRFPCAHSRRAHPSFAAHRSYSARMKLGRTDRSHYPVTRQFSPAKLCQCAREHRSLPRLDRLQRACCTRCILVRERAVSVMNAILLQMDGQPYCALHRSTRFLVAIFQQRVRAAST